MIEPTTESSTCQHIAVITPCYDDFDCIISLAEELDTIATDLLPATDVCLLVINDSPWIHPPQHLLKLSDNLKAVNIRIVDLASNLGHQRALAIGIAWIASRIKQFSYVITMDADGEDDPADIPAMINRLRGEPESDLACVARRRSRSETWSFRLSYQVYKSLTRFLAGDAIDYGNFICFRPVAVSLLARSPDASIHLAAALKKSRLPFVRIDSDRRPRYSGISKMSGYSSLVIHAFRAYSVQGERIAVRLLMFNVMLFALVLVLAIFAIGARFSGVFELFPGWASLALLNLMSLLAIITMGIFSLALTLVTSRSAFITTPLDLMEKYLNRESRC